MLLKYSVKNYMTFKDKAELSFIASNYDKTTLEQSNIYHQSKFNLRVLKSAAIYGANASGKTKLIDSLHFMKKFVLSSSKESQKGEQIEVLPFLLSEETCAEPSEFEINFLYNETLYRYGFEVTKDLVLSEWLYYRPNTKEVEIFYRDAEGLDVHERLFSKGAMLKKENLIRDNALVLSVAAQFNDEIAGTVMSWFRNLGIISGLQDAGYKGYTMSQLMDGRKKKTILNLLKSADLGIMDIKVEKMDIEDIPKDIPADLKNKIIDEIKNDKSVYLSESYTTHYKYNSKLEKVDNVSFSMEDEESHGTRKFFYLLGPILNSLDKGYPLVIDELDSRLHPNLVEKIVSLFNSEIVNKNNSQLVFNSHNTRVFNSENYRRDQIWFIEKDSYGASNLYSLSDFKSGKVRKNDNFEERYLEGRYGAIPYLNSLEEQLVKDMEPEYEDA